MPSKPVLLDLFCGAGGAAKGYQEAGFYVIGIDHQAQPNYCGDEFKVDEVMDFLDGRQESLRRHVSAIHASPPCQAYAEVAQGRKKNDHPELIDPIRKLLREIGVPWVIENVPPAPMPNSFILCGSTFDLPVIRHRRFEVEPKIVAPENSKCPQKSFLRAVSHGPGFYPYARKSWGPAWKKNVLPIVWPWMTIKESGQAIPPAYTKYIGEKILEGLA